MGKERFELLLEGIEGSVKLIAEGHDALRSEMRQMEERLTNKIDAVDKKTDLHYKMLDYDIKETRREVKETKEELGAKIDKIDRKLDLHIKQPAHA